MNKPLVHYAIHFAIIASLSGVTLAPAAFAKHTDSHEIRNRAFTIADGISSTRFMVRRDGSAVFLSPDRQRYAIALVSGDVAANRVRLDIRVGDILHGRPGAPVSVKQLFTDGLGSSAPGNGFSNLSGPSGLIGNSRANAPRWIDDHHLALLWPDARSRSQVYVLDVVTRKGRFVTNAEDDIMAFAASSTGALIVDVRTPPDRAMDEQGNKAGLTVTGNQLLPIIGGYAPGTTGTSFADFTRKVGNWRQGEAGELAILRADGAMARQNYYSMLQPGSAPIGNLISPDGRFALTDETPPDYNNLWLNYDTPDLNVFRKSLSCRAVRGGANQCWVRQLYLADLTAGTSEPLFDAPLLLGDVKAISWSPSGRWLLFGPTYLPTSAVISTGGKGWVIVDLQRRGVVSYPKLPEIDESGEITWEGDDRIVIQNSTKNRTVFIREEKSWRVADTTAVRPDSRRDGSVVDVISDANTPPKLYYKRPNGLRTLLLDPNPQLANFDLARVEMFRWRDSDGVEWEGRLYLPSGKWGKQRPLVIQQHSYTAADEFSLYGGPSTPGVGIGPGRSVFIAQSLASHGIAVLSVGGAPRNKPRDYSISGTQYDLLERSNRAVVAGISELVHRGIVDPARVGIMGYSAGGKQVEHAIAFGDFPYAAALVDDAAEQNYLQNIVYNFTNGMAERLSGPEMIQWVARSPAFNADRVRTPIYFQVGSPVGGIAGIVAHWEMYAALSGYGRPVEYYIIPEFLRGTHIIQNPRQLMAVQNRALDWWLFWLKDEKDSASEKRGQYESWERMRQLAEKARQEPRRPLLEWTSSPK